MPGLDATPILDVQISVAALEPTNPFRVPLEKRGWTLRAGNPDLMKRYFRERPGQGGTQLQVRRAGRWSEQLALLLRHCLRAHPDDAALKHGLAEVFGAVHTGYTHAKGPFIWGTLRRADEWAQRTCWAPGLSEG